MSHTLRKVNLGNSALAETTIIDYVQGGEPYTLAELGLTGGLVNVRQIESRSFDGSLPNYVVSLVGNKIRLENAPGIELPTTPGLNFTFYALVQGA